MNQTKVVIVGAGSYVFGPSMLHQALYHHRLPHLELVLLDVDRAGVEIMAACGRRLAGELGLDTKITATTDRPAALDGADFVVYCAAMQGLRRFQMDVEIIRRVYPAHVITEFGGVAGIAYTLRQVALLETVVADIRRCCPRAWLLNSANPMPRLSQAAHELGVQTAGFCSVSIAGLNMLHRLLCGQPLPYPFRAAREKWDFTMAGMNHFAWLVELTDRRTGQDLYGLVRQELAAGTSTGEHLADDLCRRTGYLLVPGDDHTQDFLPPSPYHKDTHAFHGNPEERQRRLDALKAAAEGRGDLTVITGRSCWEWPIDLIAAMAYGREGATHALDLVNQGQLPGVDGGAFVETPARLTRQGPQPVTVQLPDSTLPYARSAAAVHNAVTQAALKRSRKLLRTAIELDPTISEPALGWAAMEESLRAHADVLPVYGQ